MKHRLRTNQNPFLLSRAIGRLASDAARRRSVSEQSIPKNRNPCYRSFLGIASPRTSAWRQEWGKGFKPFGLSRDQREAGASDFFCLNRS
jgi:hypothetical protein